MAFKIKQDNYEKKPTAQQRRALEACGAEIPATRIEAHLKLAALNKTPEGKAALIRWKDAVHARRNNANAIPDGTIPDGLVQRTVNSAPGTNP